MPGRNSELERAMTAALQSRSAAYARAHAALEALQQRLSAGETLQRVSPQLQRILESIRTEDDRLAPLQREWGESKLTAGPELAAEIESHQAQLERTLAFVDRLVSVAEADRSQLAPRLDEAALGRRMQAAYSAAERY